MNSFYSALAFPKNVLFSQLAYLIFITAETGPILIPEHPQQKFNIWAGIVGDYLVGYVFLFWKCDQ